MNPCAVHPDEAAVAQCAGCHKAICEGCVAPGSDPALCFDCSINNAGRAVDQDADRSKQRSAVQDEASSGPTLAPAIKLVAIIGSIIIVLQVTILLFLAKPEETMREQAGSIEPERQATAVAIANTILVSEELERYREDHGSYPSSLEALSDAFPPPLDSLLDRKVMDYKTRSGVYTLSQRNELPIPVEFDSKRGHPIFEETP